MKHTLKVILSIILAYIMAVIFIKTTGIFLTAILTTFIAYYLYTNFTKITEIDK